MKPPEHISLKTGVNALEDAIITLSGPALAISGILAGVDLLTGGHLLQQVAWLAMTWAICLLLTLDFQVLSLGARAHKVYLSDKATRRKAFEIALSFLIAAAISFVSIQMQSIIARVNGSGLSIDQAAAQLGVNTIALIWERSALVLVLIFMSGWFREEQAKQSETASVSSGTPAALSDKTVELILSKLAKLDALEQALSQPQITVLAEQETPLALPETVSSTSALRIAPMGFKPIHGMLSMVEQITANEDHQGLLVRPSVSDETLETAGETEVNESDLEAIIKNILVEAPALSSRDVASIVGQPHSTVYRHMARVKQSMKQTA